MRGPVDAKVFSVKVAVFTDATLGQMGPPDNVGPVPDGFARRPDWPFVSADIGDKIASFANSRPCARRYTSRPRVEPAPPRPQFRVPRFLTTAGRSAAQPQRNDAGQPK